jgi:hypothetical protein
VAEAQQPGGPVREPADAGAWTPRRDVRAARKRAVAALHEHVTRLDLTEKLLPL